MVTLLVSNGWPRLIFLLYRLKISKRINFIVKNYHYSKCWMFNFLVFKPFCWSNIGDLEILWVHMKIQSLSFKMTPRSLILVLIFSFYRGTKLFLPLKKEQKFYISAGSVFGDLYVLPSEDHKIWSILTFWGIFWKLRS